MMPTDFVHISLLALGGEVRGKTTLQKKIYFLGVLTGAIDDLGYRAHFYGPYSDDVALAIQELKTIGYVEQEVHSTGMADASGFERCRYDFRLTPVGERVARAKAAASGPLWGKLEEVAKRLEAAGSVDYMKLSIAAKTYFLLRQPGVRPSKDELARLASKFGWHVKPEEIQEAATYLERLALVRSA